MFNPLKTLVLSAAILMAFSATSTEASVVIDGAAYPDGCYKIAPNIICPAGSLDARLEAGKRISPPKMPGHSSNGTVAPQPIFQDPAVCLAAVSRLNDKLADTQYWFRRAIYQTKELTAQAGTDMRDYIRTYSIRAMSYGKSIYRNARRGEDGAGLCKEFVDQAYNEVSGLFELIRAEAKAGNRDLENTGLNPNASVYNN